MDSKKSHWKRQKQKSHRIQIEKTERDNVYKKEPTTAGSNDRKCPPALNLRKIPLIKAAKLD